MCPYLGMGEERVSKRILDQHPGGRRKPGRPRKGCLDDVTKDLEVLGIRGWRRRALGPKNGRNLQERPGSFMDCSAGGLIDL
jgi:hypothetical protein